MPPLPDTLYDETRTKVERIERRLGDAASFQIPRLRNHLGTLALQQQYAAELREDLESCRRELQILETFVDDIVSAQHRKEINDQLDILIPRVEELKKESRAALLASKRNIDAQAPSYREELLRSSTLQTEGPSRGQRGNNSDDAVMHASEAATEALRQTTQLMQQELERSISSTQMLGLLPSLSSRLVTSPSFFFDDTEESTRTMSTTSDLYTIFGTFLTTSKHLVTTLEKSDWLDRLLILSSLAFFLLAVAYIIKKRVIDKGLWLAFWWIKYLPLPASRSLAASTVSASLSQTQGYMTSASLTATSLIVTIPSASTIARSSLAEEISSLASAAFEFEHPEPTEVSILAESIIEDVLARAAETGSHEITLEVGGENADRLPQEETRAKAGVLREDIQHLEQHVSSPPTPLSTEHVHQEL